MGRPGAMCTRAAHPDHATCDGVSFASLARTLLHGKRILVYGDSVSQQVHFAMLCSLQAHGLLERWALLYKC